MKDTFKKQWWLYISIIMLVVFGGFNLCNNKNFFDAPLYVILNLAVALYIAFYFTQRKNDERKAKDIIESIINKLQGMILDEGAYVITQDTSARDIMMMQRTIRNKIKLLDDNKKRFKITAEVEHIDNQFKGYCDFIGEYIDNRAHLSDSQRELKNYLYVIDDKFDEIKIKLYMQ